MKTLKHILLAGFSATLLLTSCNMLEVDNRAKLTADNFYKNTKDLELAAPGIALKFNGAFNQNWSNTYGGDDITSKNAGNKIGFHNVDVFATTSSNDRINNWWNYFYATIKTCNTMIIRTKENKIDSIAANKPYLAIAHFYRAMSYFFLTRSWGKVPLVLDLDNPNSRPLTEIQAIYDVIVSDLKYAEEYLPDTYDKPYKQQGVNVIPCKGAAQAALANVYLTMGGWPLKQADKYAMAATEAKKVIDNKDTYGFGLEDITQLWKLQFTKETVFGCYYNINIANGQWENDSQMAPRTFGPAEEGGWEDGYGELAFYNEFPEGPRKEATYEMTYLIGKKAPYTEVTYKELAEKHPFFLKYRYANANWETHRGFNWKGNATTPVIRYAEVLLTYAEAKARSGQLDQSAYDAINAVRERAGLNDLSGLSQQQFIDAVIAERGWEFAGPEPAARWFDLVRTETVAIATVKRDPSEQPIDPKNMPNDQTHAKYWMPIPIEE